MSNAFLVQLCNGIPSRIGFERAAISAGYREASLVEPCNAVPSRTGSKHATIGAGYREACDVAKARLEELTVDNSKDEAKFRQDLLNIAKTTLRWGAELLDCCEHSKVLGLASDALAGKRTTALQQAAGVRSSARMLQCSALERTQAVLSLMPNCLRWATSSL